MVHILPIAFEEMNSEDHRLLLEALMFFSCGDDSDDSINDGGQPSDASDDADAAKTAPFLSTAKVHDIHVRHNTISTRKPAKATMPTTKPRRRKRVRKCTYAARREEAIRLTACAIQLEAQLQHLQKRMSCINAWQQQAECKRRLLAQSRAENQRLRLLLAEGEVRIKHAQAQRGYAVQEFIL